MNSAKSPRRSGRDNLEWSRHIVANPERHTRPDIYEACDVMIRFGNLDDLSKASRLREDIAKGRMKGLQHPPRHAVHRHIRLAAIVAVVVWTVAWIIGAVVDAQAAGNLPALSELVR